MFYVKDRYHSISYRTFEKIVYIFLTILPLIAMSGKNSVSGSAHAGSSPERILLLRLKAEDPTECTPLNLHSLRSRAMTTNL